MKPGSLDCGVVLVDKPAGKTSHDVVAAVRRDLSTAAGRKVKTGHAGTLDPFATGLLVILVGRATRLQRYLLHEDKSYRVVARLGWTSDSGDVDGELTHTGRVPADPQLPTGELTLPVPAYSAIKVAGERLYARARRGEEFEPPVREMTVYRAERMAFDGERATFEIDCAGGTYVRSVVATLEDAYCEELRRTRCGSLRAEDADAGTIVDPVEALREMPALRVDEAGARALIHGRTLPAPGGHGGGSALRAMLGDSFVGVVRVDGAQARPETVLAASVEELAAR